MISISSELSSVFHRIMKKEIQIMEFRTGENLRAYVNIQLIEIVALKERCIRQKCQTRRWQKLKNGGFR